MTYAPDALQQLSAYWASQGGVPLGIVGDARHRHGYHLGDDRLERGDYSILTVRDRAGLTNAASAIDLGRLDRSLPNLYAFSAWLVERCRTHALGTADVREVIYSPDGDVVLRWDRERGTSSRPRPGEGDDTHLTHTHISFYRDSEHRDKVPLIAPYFEEAQMSGDFAIYDAVVESRRTGLLKAQAVMYNDRQLSDRRGATGPAARVEMFGNYGDVVAVQVRTAQGWPDNVVRATMVFVRRADLTDVQDAPPVTTDTTHAVALLVDGVPKWEGSV